MTAPMMRKRNPTPHSKGVSKMPAITRMTPTRRSALRFSIDGPRRTSHVKVWHSFRALLACPAPEGLLWQLPAGVRDDQRPVVLPEHGLELFVVQVLDEPAGDRGPDGVRLAHHPASLDVDVDVDRVDLPSCEFQRLEDLEASELELVHLDRDAVDPHDPAAFREGRPRHRRLPLPTGDDGLHADPPNLEPRRVAISPRLMYGPWGGRFATSIVSRGFSLNSSGTDR